MILIDSLLIDHIKKALVSLYQVDVHANLIQLQQTKPEFDGDRTLVVFPLLKTSKKSPEATADDIGNYLKSTLSEVADYNVIKGFLNIVIDDSYWLALLNHVLGNEQWGCIINNPNARTIVVEYSSPNTNKPLHLGHIRNNLLGYSVAKLLKAAGHKVFKVNLVNDRGIHICKSMLAWQKFAQGETPESSGKKGDHLVGDYYVKFDQWFKQQVDELKASGMKEDEAKKQAPAILEAQDMLLKWEQGDEQVNKLWEMMNGWVYKGFDVTYKSLGVDFDKIYYESQTYLLGKEIVIKGLKDGVLFKKEDGSVWADLTDRGLDQKLLLRADGTSVYMTQDIGTALLRHDDYKADDMIYVVGNEQNYHFQVLSIVLDKLGYEWGQRVKHLSYGMVELPEGKMKSREGTVVDADDLIAEMIGTARQMSLELGKLDGYSEEEKQHIFRIIGLGALKYFILKVDPKKNMTFNPAESIDFNGNTGPFIQYTYARINSVMTKARESGIDIQEKIPVLSINKVEKELLKQVYQYPEVVKEAADSYNPGLIANYTYDLAKAYNQFYHDHPILKNDDVAVRDFRLSLSLIISRIIKSGMDLMGIEVPERM